IAEIQENIEPESELTLEQDHDVEEFGLTSDHDELSLEEETINSSETDEFIVEFIDESEPGAELSLDSISDIHSESEEFSFGTEESIAEIQENIEPESELTLEQDDDVEEFGLTSDHGELSLEEETINSSETDEFMVEFIDESEPGAELSLDNISEIHSESEEFSFEETSSNDEEFENLMGAFAEDSQLIDNELGVDSQVSDLQFEDVEPESDELSSLDAIDKKLDELTQISDESLGELNELLDSVQQNELEEKQLDEIYQDN
ncbi:MAG: hypothetical protein AAGA16_16365, partial [Cyanobacteria bacterium P01_E01_bin.35]